MPNSVNPNFGAGLRRSNGHIGRRVNAGVARLRTGSPRLVALTRDDGRSCRAALLAAPGQQFTSDLPMAGNAQSTVILQRTLTAAFHHGGDVVGVPGRAQALVRDAERLRAAFARMPGKAAQRAGQSHGIGLAEGADAAIAAEDLFAHIGGTGTHTPLVH